eukprot:5703360-Amphidinium_carterae.1
MTVIKHASKNHLSPSPSGGLSFVQSNKHCKHQVSLPGVCMVPSYTSSDVSSYEAAPCSGAGGGGHFIAHRQVTAAGGSTRHRKFALRDK